MRGKNLFRWYRRLVYDSSSRLIVTFKPNQIVRKFGSGWGSVPREINVLRFRDDEVRFSWKIDGEGWCPRVPTGMKAVIEFDGRSRLRLIEDQTIADL